MADADASAENGPGAETERGASSVEYAIIGSLIAAVIVVIVTTLGGHVHDLFDTVAGKF